MNLNKDYEMLHKFLLPHMKLEDVLINMNDFKNDHAKIKKDESTTDLASGIKPVVPDTPADTPVVQKTSRKQKRLQERNREKVVERTKKDTDKKFVNKEKMAKRLEQIKRDVEDSKKRSGFADKDINRIDRIAFGTE